ncbi:GTP-binding protein [Ruegeria sp. HKCCD8929]|uniref:CobW family GTP-binding protein n=1 Tax=Ruegeria sp. HKCCD8929 TaxID=2683006 RepID=UPI0014886321
MTRLPLSVVGGYLGAGKTTLINRLLSEDHGLRLMVLVNDFGAINIDAALLASTDEDTIALTNGCVCCTMGADLFMAVGDVLDRAPRPDHLIIEASGIADPAAIANVARAEPELSYAGIVTVVDAGQIGGLLDDAQIAPQIRQQIGVADLVVLTKTDDVPGEVAALLAPLHPRAPVLLGGDRVTPLLLDVVPMGQRVTPSGHPAYTGWHCACPQMRDRAALQDKLERRPGGIWRIKGLVQTGEGMIEVQVVGANCELRAVAGGQAPGLVALGLADRVTRAEIEGWWSGT